MGRKKGGPSCGGRLGTQKISVVKTQKREQLWEKAGPAKKKDRTKDAARKSRVRPQGPFANENKDGQKVFSAKPPTKKIEWREVQGKTKLPTIA